MPVPLGAVAETGQKRHLLTQKGTGSIHSMPHCPANAQGQHLLVSIPETGPSYSGGTGITGTKQQGAKTGKTLLRKSLTSGVPDSLSTKKASNLHSEAISRFDPHVAKT